MARGHASATRHPRRCAAPDRSHFGREHHLRRKMEGSVTQIAAPLTHRQDVSGNVLEQKCAGWREWDEINPPKSSKEKVFELHF